MNVHVVIATYGDEKWHDLACGRALESADREAAEISCVHYSEATLAEARNQAALDPSPSGLPVRADWLCFLDADDELEPRYLERMASAYQEQLFTAVAHTVSPLFVPKVRRVMGEVTTGVPAAIPNRGRWPQVNECVIGTLVHRDLFERVGGFRDHTTDGTEIAMYEDWDLWLRCWDAGAKLVYTDAVYREHVSQGRNTNAHLAQPVYDAIWADHRSRVAWEPSDN